MRVFLYEHITATCGTDDPLYVEGAAMRDALRADLAKVDDVEFIEGLFDNCASAADWTILIAPETGGILQGLAERVLQLGGRLLGSSPEAIRLASDKLALCERWQAAGVRTPETCLVSPKRGGREAIPEEAVGMSDASWSPWLTLRANKALIVKPRDGAGSERTALIRNVVEYHAFLAQHSEGMIVQPFVSGIPVSIAYLVGPRQILALKPTRQIQDEHFHYLGGELPLPPDLVSRAQDLGLAALKAAGPGWLGYVGIDMILGDDGDYAIEINPRLTYSYVGLRTATEMNLAEVMLRTAEERPTTLFAWKPRRTSWRVGQPIRHSD